LNARIQMKSLDKALFTKTLMLVIYFIATGASKSSAQGKFVQNLGQWNDSIVSRAEIMGGAIYLCKNQVRYNFLNAKDMEPLHSDPYKMDTCSVHGQAFFLQWLGANPGLSFLSQNQYPEYYNYFIGNDPKHWKSGVHAYSDVNYNELYPGIDLSMSADGTDLEYTYTVLPGANPSDIQIKIMGAEKVCIQDSDLIIKSPMVNITEKSPYAYQVVEGVKTNVPCQFVVNNDIESFVFPHGYYKNLPLIIDPVVIFATYSGSYSNNFGFTGTYDSLGNSYAGGDIFGAGYPTTPGAYQTTYQGGTNGGPTDNQVFDGEARDVGILKFTPDGKALVFATYLGGKKGNEQPSSMVVDHSGNLIVFGTTASTDFPVTSSAFQSTLAGKTDMYISKFSPDGKKLLASTFVGGKDFDGLNGVDTATFFADSTESRLDYNYGDQFRGEVVVDNANNFYIASSTFSPDFPTTSGCYQPHMGGGRQDACILKIDSNLHTLVWSTFLGGTKAEGAYSLQLDHNNGVYVCGGTLSPYFFPSGSAYQNFLAGDADGFICHIKNDGSAVLGATYYGTSSYDQTYIVRLDNSDNAYVFGQTLNHNFPSYNVKYTNPHSGNFITKFNDSLTKIIYSTDIGSGKGRPDMSPSAFLVDKCERLYISGWGGEISYPYYNKIQFIDHMPVTPDAFQPKTVDSSDFYLAVFERNMDTLLYGSYFGGPISQEHVHGGSNDFDKNGIVYQCVCGGCGGNSDFPTTPGAWSRTNNSDNCNNVMFKIDLSIVSLRADFITARYACHGLSVAFQNSSKNAASYLWDFGDGSSLSTDTAPTHIYQQAGTYTITLVVTNPNSCVGKDTLKKVITIYNQGNPDFTFHRDSCSLTVKFLQTGQNTTTSWSFGDGTYSDSANPVHAYPSQGRYVVRLLVDSGTPCADTSITSFSITGPKANFRDSFPTCSPNIIYFINLSTGALSSRKWYLPFASTDTSKNPVDSFATSKGIYDISLVVTDSTGCRDSISKIITLYPKPNAAFSDSANVCGTKVFVKNLSTGVNSFTWHFSDGTTSRSDSLTHIFPYDTIISIILITDSGALCADTVKKTIKTNLPKAGFTYFIDTCTGHVLFSSTSIGAASYIWQYDAKDSGVGKNVIFTYPVKGQYPVKLTAISSGGCIDTITQVLNITNSNQKLFIPNVFTPNGDIYNNTFVITGLDPCDTYNLSIYNRWGQIFYNSVGNSFSWDGVYHGVKVPEGVYYYVFHGRKEGQLTGTITVIY